MGRAKTHASRGIPSAILQVGALDTRGYRTSRRYFNAAYRVPLKTRRASTAAAPTCPACMHPACIQHPAPCPVLRVLNLQEPLLSPPTTPEPNRDCIHPSLLLALLRIAWRRLVTLIPVSAIGHAPLRPPCPQQRPREGHPVYRVIQYKRGTLQVIRHIRGRTASPPSSRN